MQPWFGLSDPGMEEARHDTIPLRPLARRQPGYAPDEPPICQFRHWREQHERTKGRFSVSRPPLRPGGSGYGRALLWTQPSSSPPPIYKEPERTARSGNEVCAEGPSVAFWPESAGGHGPLGRYTAWR